MSVQKTTRTVLCRQFGHYYLNRILNKNRLFLSFPYNPMKRLDGAGLIRYAEQRKEVFYEK